MILDDLCEARRNPELNSDRTRDRMARYFSPEYYVTFTAIPKVGINPNSQYNTPLGIYTYPLGNAQVQKYHKRKNFPYASNQPWVNIIRAKSNNILHLDDASVDWMALTIKMRKLYIKRVRHLIDNDDIIGSIEQLMSAQLTSLADYTAFVNTPGGRFWNYTRMIARLVDLTHEGNEPVTLQSVADDIDLLKTSSIHVNSARWTKLFIDIGIEGVLDNGKGIIHRNEPEQAVFFTTRAFDLVDRWENTTKFGRIQEVNTKAELNYIIRYASKKKIVFGKSFLRLLGKSLRIATSGEAYMDAYDEKIAILGGIGFENTLDSIYRFIRYTMNTGEFSDTHKYDFANIMMNTAMAFANEKAMGLGIEEMKREFLTTGRMNNPQSQAIVDMLKELGLTDKIDLK